MVPGTKRWGAFERDGGACGLFERLTEAALVLHILSWLELEDIFKLRLVCKSWYHAVLSPLFIRLFMERHRLDDPWVVSRVRTEEPADRYNTTRNFEYDPKVPDDYFDYKMKLASHPELWRPYTPNRRKKCSLPLGPLGSPFIGMWSSNGLVCGRLTDEKHTLTLAVGNPLTNQWRKLVPAPIDPSNILRTAYLSVFMETDPLTGRYIIVVFYRSSVVEEEYVYSSDTEPNETVYVVQYESEAGVWEAGTRFSTRTSVTTPPQPNSFIFDGLFKLGLSGYDPVRRQWWYFDVPDPVYEGWYKHRFGIFMYKGKCVWVGELGIVDTGEWELGAIPDTAGLGAAVWELDDKRKCWTLLSTVTWKELFGDSFCMTFNGLTDRRMQVVGDTVIISTLYRRETYGDRPPVAYDMVSSRWYTCVEPEEFGSHWKSGNSCLPFDMECCYGFIPSLTARP